VAALGIVAVKNATLEAPPPGAGLITVTDAVVAFATSDDRIEAVSCAWFTKCVVRGLPFQFTTEVETNPVPFTVNVKPEPPGMVAIGTRGWLMSGTGFAMAPANSRLERAKLMVNKKMQRHKGRVRLIINSLGN
jgi:hypothetical protein